MIKIQEEKGKAMVTVADQGEKIPQELAQSMFKPFVCGDISRASGNGSGLGLAIARSIVRTHGGELMYQYTEQSNQFVLTLPLMEKSR